MRETSLGHVPVQIFPNAETLGEHLAAEILTGVSAVAVEGRPYLLGCPGGRSLRTTYRALGRQAAQTKADLSGLVIVMMDNYLIPSGEALVACDDDLHYSCRRFAVNEIRDFLNAGLPEANHVCDENIWLPDPAEPARYDAQIQAAGGIDLFLTASGASDGHVAFNCPPTDFETRTRIVTLPDSTRRDNLATFPEFDGIDDVPRRGVTVGVSTIVEESRRVVLVIHSADKLAAVRRLTRCNGYDPDWPVSLIFRAKAPCILMDATVAVGLAGDAN